MDDFMTVISPDYGALELEGYVHCYSVLLSRSPYHWKAVGAHEGFHSCATLQIHVDGWMTSAPHSRYQERGGTEMAIWELMGVVD